MYTHNHSQNMPYGAFEMKACYQRNVLVGQMVLLTLLTLGLTGPKAYHALFGETIVEIPVVEDEGPSVPDTLGQPPTIEREEMPAGPTPPLPPEVDVSNQIVALPDSTWSNDQVEQQLPTQSELIQLNGVGDTGGTGSGIDTMALQGGDYLPDIDSFVVLEIYPQMIHMETPVYPSIARATGISGRVIVKVLLDEEGKVIDARVLVSSESTILDDAAIRAAYKNVFSPGVQNGIPVKCWVSYKVDFSVNR